MQNRLQLADPTDSEFELVRAHAPDNGLRGDIMFTIRGSGFKNYYKNRKKKTGIASEEQGICYCSPTGI